MAETCWKCPWLTPSTKPSLCPSFWKQFFLKNDSCLLSVRKLAKGKQILLITLKLFNNLFQGLNNQCYMKINWTGSLLSIDLTFYLTLSNYFIFTQRWDSGFSDGLKILQATRSTDCGSDQYCREFNLSWITLRDTYQCWAWDWCCLN